jgi:hypothetical protein
MKMRNYILRKQLGIKRCSKCPVPFYLVTFSQSFECVAVTFFNMLPLSRWGPFSYGADNSTWGKAHCRWSAIYPAYSIWVLSLPFPSWENAIAMTMDLFNMYLLIIIIILRYTHYDGVNKRRIYTHYSGGNNFWKLIIRFTRNNVRIIFKNVLKIAL